MLNELVFCPRLFFLEFVEREFDDNAFTVEGRLAHRRADQKSGEVPDPVERPFVARSVELSSQELGISAKIDVVEGEAGELWPIDYKRGSPPDTVHSAWEPERVQVCAYGLLLREHGFRCDQGLLYFAEAKTRVPVAFDAELVSRTLDVIAQAKALATTRVLPPPLVGSSKCQGCSLHAICLPDETNALREPEAATASQGRVRPFLPGRDDAQPLFIVEQGARVGLTGEELRVTGRGRTELSTMRLLDVSQVILWGNIQVSAQAARELMSRDIPICWMSFGGWLAGVSNGLGHGNIHLRRMQFRAADDEARCLAIARRIVRTKILNSRTMLRRNHEGEIDPVLGELHSMAEQATVTGSLQELLGVEGNAARLYFQNLGGMIRAEPAFAEAFDFTTRSRRPPRDPVNALLSLAYSLLTREVTCAVRVVGMDPYLGFYHQTRFGRPALALDLMEEFRPLLADSAVLKAINTRVVGPSDFITTKLGVSLKDASRRAFIKAWEQRLGEEVTHPVFGYRISYRRVLAVQARLFARYLLGELSEVPEFRTR
jgi:CRISPR-associated protein Cas1